MHRGWSSRPVRLVALLCLAAIPPAAEAAALRATGMGAIAGIAPHVTAPPPFGVYHDLRWVLVLHRSWLGLAGEMAALVAFRTLLNTGLILAAWPEGRPRPGVRSLLVSNALVTLLLVALMWPWAALAGMSAATSLSWFVMASLLGVGMLGLVINRAGMVPGWWRHPPTPASVGTGLVVFIVLSAASAVVSVTPGLWAAGAAGASGLAMAGLWRLLVGTVAGRRSRSFTAFATPLAVIAGPILVVALGAHMIGVVHGTPDRAQRPAHADRLSSPDRRQVIYLLGYGTHYEGQVMSDPPPGTAVTYFSYRGQYADGAPLPYGPRDTAKSITAAARLLARQVGDLHRRTGRPVALMAVSEGTFVAREYLRTHPDGPVHTVVLLSPLIRPARIYYPPRDARAGWGIGMGWAFRAVAAVSRWRTGSMIGADQPFIRSVLDREPYFRTAMMKPVPHKRIVAFVPMASAAAVPDGHLSGIPIVEAPSVHGFLIHQPRVRKKIFSVLDGADVPPHDPLSYRLVRAAAAGWQVPPLPLALLTA